MYSKFIVLQLLIVLCCLNNSGVTGFRILWFGSDEDGSQGPSFGGTPPIDYGECDWIDPNFSPAPPLPTSQQYDSRFPGDQQRINNFGHGFGEGRRGPPPMRLRQQPNFNPSPLSSSSLMGDGSFDSDDITAIHKTLPIGSYVTVVNENNNHSVVVRIVGNDGPHVVGRIMTLSKAAFYQLADLDEGVVPCFVGLK